MINFKGTAPYDFAALRALVSALRAPGGCPWDAAQTHLSIRRNFLEEAYEACEAFDLDNPDMMCEELGDVLLQVLFHTDIERAAGRFTLEDVCDRECRKLIFRHPQLFGGEEADWEELKKREKGQRTLHDSMQGVAKSLPALWRAEKLAKKARQAHAGDDEQALLAQLRAAADAVCAQKDPQALGRLLFTAAALAGEWRQDPEQLTHEACERFMTRFTVPEPACTEQVQAKQNGE